MARTRFNLGLGAAALVLLASSGIGRADGPLPVGPAGPCCAAEGCCQEKVCIPAPVTKKIVLRHYGVKCEDFCLCRPSFLGGLLNIQEAREKDRDLYVGRGPCDQPCGECGGCDSCGNCGRPHVKKYLLIHLRTHEECEIKCQTPEEIVAAEAAKGPAKAPAKAPATPMAAPGENPQPRTPRLDPAK